MIPGPDVEQDVLLIVHDFGSGECSRHGSGYADRGREFFEFSWASSIDV